MMLSYEECPTCRVKPGMPTLCAVCFWRRTCFDSDTASVRKVLSFESRVPPPLDVLSYQIHRFRVQQLYECVGGAEWWDQYEH